MSLFRRELFWIFFIFLLPLFAAVSYFSFLSSGRLPLTTSSYGHLFPPGVKWQGHYHEGSWSFIHLPQRTSSRFDLWCQQTSLIEQMLGPLSEKFADKIDDSQVRPGLLLESWDYSLEKGALLVVDARGYLVLGYSYDQEPRKVFIELKKLIKSTS